MEKPKWLFYFSDGVNPGRPDGNNDGIGRDQRAHTNMRRFTLAGSRGQAQWSRPEPSPRREKRKVDAVEQRVRDTWPPVKPRQAWKKHHPKRTRIGLRSAFGA
jgi:hypothetical protein